jgi:hypothetical protein
MRSQWLRCILGVSALVAGCSPIANGVRTMIIEPLQYCTTGDEILSRMRTRRLAEAAWDEIVKANPEPNQSADHADGFKDGFADYLFEGGTGAPPPLPPRHYWKEKYRTTEGHQAIQDWYAGYHHGAAAAQESGLRQVVVIPTCAPLLSTSSTPAVPPPSAPAELLPPARELDGAVRTPGSAEGRNAPRATAWTIWSWSNAVP